jgi:hypothetical protein
MADPGPHSDQLRRKLHEIIFEADTPGGKALPMPFLDRFLGRFEVEKGEPVCTASHTRSSSFGLTILPSFL